MLDIIQKGKLLLSEPSLLQDVVFGRSVILITEYNSEGATGFILNKPINYSVSDLIPDIEIPFPVYTGGPVEQDNLYFIHNKPEIIPFSTEISDGIFWGGDFEIVKKQINLGNISEHNIRFFLGYSGWEAGQLEDELQSSSWIVVSNPYKNTILTKAHSDFWKEQLKTLGEKYAVWLNAPENPELN